MKIEDENSNEDYNENDEINLGNKNILDENELDIKKSSNTSANKSANNFIEKSPPKLSEIPHKNTLDMILTELKKLLKANELIVFCGAGISFNSGLPLVNDFMNYILKKMDPE